MKKLIFTLLLAVLWNSSFAQCTVYANAIAGITLQCDMSQGQTARSAVAYNPNFNLYYSVDAGSSGYPIETFSASGTYLNLIAQGFDYRGLWWNPNTNKLDGNEYNGTSIASQNLDGVTGYPLGSVTTLFPGAQPNDQSAADYDYDDNEILYYDNGIYYRYDGTTYASLGTVTITGLPVTTGNLNSNTAFYTGCTGKEYGVYDCVNKRFYFIDKATGAYVATSQLPVSAPAPSQFQASYANGKLWLFNTTDFKWYSYEVLQPCTPPSATITPAGPTSFCPGGSVVLNANTGTGYTYQWKLNGTDITGATSSSYTAAASGNYTVMVTENACPATSTAVVITVLPLPATVTTPSGNVVICQGNSTTIVANSGTGYIYQWLNNNTPISGQTSANIIVSTAGTYAVEISDGTCMDTSAVVNVTVAPLPVPVITQAGNLLSTTTFVTYQWLLNNNIISGAVNQTYMITQPGVYRVIVTDANACNDTSAAFTPVSVGDILIKELSIYPNPSHGNFVISGHINSDKASIRITDITGRIITEEEVPVKNRIIEKEIALPQLSAGTYMLFITCDNERQVVPLTIN